MDKLKFSPMANNKKLTKISHWSDNYTGYTFSLPSGYTCPSANECLSKADKHTGKIKDGKNSRFRCFSASTESVYKNTRDQRWYNFELLRKLDKTSMAHLIADSIPTNANLIRIHVGGDFFNQDYFDAWATVAIYRDDVTFYAYTKSLRYWVKQLGFIYIADANYKLIASRGGTDDHLIDKYGLRSSVVVQDYDQAQSLGLEIDYDERLAITGNQDFALLLHGTQPKQINNMVGV